jgi:S1-C subfamily serine protease
MTKKKEVKEDFSNTTSVDIRSIEKNKVEDVDVTLNKDNTKVFFVILAIVTILVSLIGSYLIVKFTKGNNARTKTILDYKNISIKDDGISAPVLKVYDAVVVVETYVNDKLYATGTGFVFREDEQYGYILTNHHVIEDGYSFKVRFTDDNIVEAKVVGSDAYSDIAVIRVHKENILTIASLGKASDLLVGDTVFTIGSPVDASTYSWSVTRGILSGKDRIVEVKGSTGSYIMNVLQTDAAINEGNSGGPLCNSNGEVIGITNMKLSSTKVESIGFAIPIEIALEYADNFISGTPIIRPYLGISMYDLGSSFFSREEGIYIRALEGNSPASNAGLKVGDVIIGIDDKDVSTTAYLKYYLYKHNIGDKVTIKYKRDGKEATTEVTLGSYDIRG